MKMVRTSVNEEQYKIYKKLARKMGLSEYGVTKKLVVDFIERKQREEKKLLIMYFFIVYSLIVTVFLLVLHVP